ncbi:MAG: P1 family peptidase [Spirochaetia bacterium]|jgi:L-aminopeptidase/D-esterase-like protein|nr:P1 family peptidase [Spirochaetia bacterium]
MRDSITDVPGIRVGHAQNLDTARGVTVILCENAKTAGIDVRGGSPGTRETDCLAPVNMVPAPHAIYFSGGSAFGLAGAGGVMNYFRDNGIGFNAWNILVPIVSGAVIFDLTVGDPLAYPDEAMGYKACENAGLEVPMGVVGAGTGALVGWAGDLDQRMKGGLGTASAVSGELIVGALVVVNCWGNVKDPVSGQLLGGTLNKEKNGLLDAYEEMKKKQAAFSPKKAGLTSHTTIGVIATNAILSKPMATRVAMMAHDGFSRAICPAHTAGEGDSIFAVTTGEVESDINIVGSMAADAMARAIAKAIRSSKSAFGYMGHEDLLKRMSR